MACLSRPKARPSWVIPLLLAVALGAGGFLLGALVDPFTEEPDPSEPLPIDLGGPGRYVSLGDSYSAGEGLAPFEEATRDIDDNGDRCHRSQEFAYSRRLTFVHPTETSFRACSGAVVDNVFNVVQRHSGVRNHLGLQVGPKTLDEDVRLVTISMGGNDLDFAKALRFCFEERGCDDQPYKEYRSLREWATGQLDMLKPTLVSLYDRLQSSFPKARILVLGYPALFPEKAPPLNRLHTAVCNILFTRWTASEREAIRGFGLSLNETILAAASEAGIEYVDIWSHFIGHEPCSTGEWVRFVGISGDRAIRDGSFHPLRQGQAMMARILSCHHAVFQSPDTPRTRTSAYAMTGCIAEEATHVFPIPDEVTGASQDGPWKSPA